MRWINMSIKHAHLDTKHSPWWVERDSMGGTNHATYSTHYILVTPNYVLAKRCIWTIFHDYLGWNFSQKFHLASSATFRITCGILWTGTPLWLSCRSVWKRLEFSTDWVRMFCVATAHSCGLRSILEACASVQKKCAMAICWHMTRKAIFFHKFS